MQFSQIRRLLIYRVQTGIVMWRQEGDYIDEGTGVHVAGDEVRKSGNRAPGRGEKSERGGV